MIMCDVHFVEPSAFEIHGRDASVVEVQCGSETFRQNSNLNGRDRGTRIVGQSGWIVLKISRRHLLCVIMIGKAVESQGGLRDCRAKADPLKSISQNAILFFRENLYICCVICQKITFIRFRFSDDLL